MHESMTSQKIKKLGAGGPSLVGGPKLLVGGHAPPGPPLATGLGLQVASFVMYNNYGILKAHNPTTQKNRSLKCLWPFLIGMQVV